AGTSRSREWWSERGIPRRRQLICVGFNFAPPGWPQCDGTLLPISQNTALFSLLGTTFGGDGISTFALPDLRGRAPIHMGQGPGLSLYIIGQNGGGEEMVWIPSGTLEPSPPSAAGNRSTITCRTSR